MRRYVGWSCATCAKIVGPDQGCDDEFPDDCDACWYWKTLAMGELAQGLFGWLP